MHISHCMHIEVIAALWNSWCKIYLLDKSQVHLLWYPKLSFTRKRQAWWYRRISLVSVWSPNWIKKCLFCLPFTTTYTDMQSCSLYLSQKPHEDKDPGLQCLHLTYSVLPCTAWMLDISSNICPESKTTCTVWTACHSHTQQFCTLLASLVYVNNTDIIFMLELYITS